jgi:hypothetical protein
MAVGRQGKVKLTSRWSCRPRCFRRTPVNVSSGAQDITKSVSQIPSRDQKPEGLLTAATPWCRDVERWKSVVGNRKTTGSESWRGRNGNRWQGRGGLEDFSVGRKRQLGFTPLTPRLVLIDGIARKVRGRGVGAETATGEGPEPRTLSRPLSVLPRSCHPMCRPVPPGTSWTTPAYPGVTTGRRCSFNPATMNEQVILTLREKRGDLG